MEITLTISLPDFRADVADFARENDLTVYYGEYFYQDEEDEDDSEYALLVSVGQYDWENRTDAETVQEALVTLIGEDELDLYTGNEYWVVFAEQPTLISCVEQFGQKIQALYPDTRFERVEFAE